METETYHNICKRKGELGFFLYIGRKGICFGCTHAWVRLWGQQCGQTVDAPALAARQTERDEAAAAQQQRGDAVRARAAEAAARRG